MITISVRDIFPSDFVANEVERSVKHGGDDHQSDHREPQLLSSEDGRSKEELAPEEDHDGKGQCVQERCFGGYLTFSLESSPSLHEGAGAVANEACKAEEGSQDEGGATCTTDGKLDGRMDECELVGWIRVCVGMCVV